MRASRKARALAEPSCGDALSAGCSPVAHGPALVLARRYVATPSGGMSTLQLTPNAASDNSSEVLTVTASISASLEARVDTTEAGGAHAYECKFVSKALLVGDGAVAPCDAPLGAGVVTVAATKEESGQTFTCPLPKWEQDGAYETVAVVLSRNPEVGTDATYPCTAGDDPLELLFYAHPTATALTPSEGGVGTVIVINGTGFLDPTDPQFDGRELVSQCRFEKSTVVDAEWVSETEIVCVAPVPTAPGPNPIAFVEVSNNGYDWTPPLVFTYKTYCGDTITLTQSTGSIADHSGSGYASLPNSVCDFKIEPLVDGADGSKELAPGGVQLSFDTLDIGPLDAVKVYHTTKAGELDLLIDAGEYFQQFKTAPPPSELRSLLVDGGEYHHGLPVVIEYRTGPVTFSSGISASYVTLSPSVGADGKLIYCPLPSLNCPAVITNTGFGRTEARQTASRLQAGERASSSVQAGVMAMHYIEVSAHAANEANDDYRIVEVEVHLANPASAVTVLVMEQPALTNSTDFATDAQTGECIDTTFGESLEVCPKGASLEADRAQPNTVAESFVSGGSVRVAYCVMPRQERNGGLFRDGEHVRLAVAVYGDSAGGAETANGVIAYQIEFRDVPMPKLSADLEFTAIDGSLVSGEGGSGAIGWMVADNKKILQVMASRQGESPGSLLVQRGACPTRSDFLYGMQPNSAGAYGVSVSDCNQTSAGCQTSTGVGEDVLWFVGLLSTAGEQAVGDTVASLTSRVKIDSANKDHGFSALCIDEAIPADYTDYTCGGAQCTHLLTPSQTHHFVARDVSPLKVLKVDACVTVDSTDGAECLPENQLSADHQLAISVSPMQAGCLDADAVAGPAWPDATFADASPPGGRVEGAAEWPFQGHYRLSRCTGGFEGDWLVSVTARIGSSSAFVPYRLSIYYQYGRLPTGAGQEEAEPEGAPPIIDLTGEAQQPEIELTTYAGDWSYFVVNGVSSANELTVLLSMPINEIEQAGGVSEQAAVELYLSDVACPDPERQDPTNYTAVTYPVLSTRGEAEQRFMVTRTIDPPEDCSVEVQNTTKTLYVGVKGASSTLLRRTGSKFKLTLSTGPIAMVAGESRDVAVQGGGYIILEVEVQTVYGLNVRAEVTEAAGAITSDTLSLIMMPKIARDGTTCETTCGAPILMNQLRDPTAVPADPHGGAVRMGGQDADGTCLVPLAVTETKDGNLLKKQWAHFEVLTVGEGTISLNVDTTCFGNCVDNDAWRNSLMLVAKNPVSDGCPNDDEDDMGNLQSATADRGVVFNADTKTLRFSVNLCTSGGGTYRIGIRGMGGQDPDGNDYLDYPAPFQGGGTDYQISSSSVPQTNMATYTLGQKLALDMANGEWQYHYLAMPDPTCASRPAGCLKGVNTPDQALNCISVDAETAAESVKEECKNNANFPAKVMLTTRAQAGAPDEGVRMFAAVGDCGTINNLDNLVAFDPEDQEFTIEYDAVELLNQYLLSQLKAIAALDLTKCEVAQVISCIQCTKQAQYGGVGQCNNDCCFTPKIYVGFNGQEEIIQGTRADYELEPSLVCQGGYKQAGRTYADACEECEPGKYSAGGKTFCDPTPPGYYSEGGEPAPVPCEPGTYSDTEAAVACTLCELGKYQPIAAKKECDDCPVGTYNPKLGQIECPPCPATFTSQRGALALRQCFCEVGFFKLDMQNANAEDDRCLECPLNAVCRGGCEDPPSENKCSDIPWMPDVDNERKKTVYGDLLYIPKAMPYPTPGYYQQLMPEFISDENAMEEGVSDYEKPDGCKREGRGACWWPFIDPDDPNPDTAMKPMIECKHCRIPTKKVQHNGQEFDEPWWLNDFKSSYNRAAMFFEQMPGPLGEAQQGFGKSLQCKEMYWTYFDAVDTGCDTCLVGPGLYFLQAGKCSPCRANFPVWVWILLAIAILLLLTALLVLSKIGFNWAAISISINFLQVSAIFANFSIEWPPEVLAVLGWFKLFTIDVDAVNTECQVGRVSYFEKWIIMVLAPFIVVSILMIGSSTLQLANWIMAHTRFPVWIKRKMWRLLKPPLVIDDVNEDDELVTRIFKRLRQRRRKLFYKVLSILTKPIPRSQLTALEDAIFNAFVTFLSVYYMTGVKRSLEIFRCIKKNPELVDARHCKNRPDDADPLMLIYTKQILKASDGAGEVVCGLYNYTTCVFDFDQLQGPPTQGLFRITINKIVGQTYAPGYNRLKQMATFFTLLYGVCIPLFIYIALTKGKHQLNHLSFGRRYGYLYKRYEVQYFWWECTVMIRKSMLSVVDIFIGLDNGAFLPGQQAVAGMCVVVTFLLLQAAFTPYSEGHLDALESILLLVNYNFLFMGLCSYAIGVSSDTSPDHDLQFLLTISMTTCLIVGVVFLVLFLSLDLTLQMVRLYFRYVEGEGKFGRRQQLVLQNLDKETRRLQELAGNLLAPEQRTHFQKWLNNEANEDEKLLSKAAFTSLSYYLKMHSDHSMPWLVQYLASFPLVGWFVTWLYKKLHELWLRYRARRNEKIARKSVSKHVSKHSGSRRASSTGSSGSTATAPEGVPESSSGGASSRAENFMRRGLSRGSMSSLFRHR